MAEKMTWGSCDGAGRAGGEGTLLNFPVRKTPLGIDPADPLFAQPWEAQVFALVLALQARGLFAWSDWSRALVGATRAAGSEGRGGYVHWLGALEALLAERGIATTAAVDARAEGLLGTWAEAHDATPHGRPVALAG